MLFWLTLALRPLLALWAANQQKPVGDVPLKKSAEEWRKELPPAAFSILVERGTEPAGSSPLDAEKRPGTFACAACRSPLFASSAKFNSGTGWPSFFDPLPSAVDLTLQPLYCIGDFGAREVRCSQCGGHLGHVFSDGPPPTGKRYCMNGAALIFRPEAKNA